MDRSSESYWERFGDMVAQFYPELSATDGIPREEIALSESRLGARLPGRLVELYARCGRRDDLLRSYNRLLSPEDIRLEDGVLFFVEENQGVSEWGLRSIDGDPPVLRRDFTDDPRWEPDHDRLSDFLVTFVLWQAVNGGAPAGGVATADRGIFRELSSWRQFPIAGSHWSDVRFFMLEKQLLCLLGTEEVSVLAAARDQPSFATLDASVNLAWDYTWPEKDG